MFAKNWFDRNIKDWTKWLAGYKDKPDLKFLEIGCFEGRGTIWLLKNILTNKTSFIITIDTFGGSIEHKGKDFVDTIEKNYLENILPFSEQVITLKGFSQEVLRSIKEYKEYDFIYIDGSHQAPDVLEDTILAWRLLKKGGIMVWDDYMWHVKDGMLSPKPAIDAFLGIFKGKYKLISKGYQVCIVKL